ncbi:MAG: hypothetical protein ACFBSF_20925 [Leptolyngbyaceae cyanobacterium]
MQSKIQTRLLRSPLRILRKGKIGLGMILYSEQYAPCHSQWSGVEQGISIGRDRVRQTEMSRLRSTSLDMTCVALMEISWISFW